MPPPDPRLVALLAGLADGHDIVCPYVGGFPQPLLAVYRAETPSTTAAAVELTR
jgi:hypothetical protein